MGFGCSAGPQSGASPLRCSSAFDMPTHLGPAIPKWKRINVTEKVFNHEVTRSLLLGWLYEGDRGDEGLWHWDLRGAARKPTFEVGKKAKFAGLDYLYVGNNDGRPMSSAIEDGLGRHESFLARFVHRLWRQDLESDSKGIQLAHSALAAILGFGNRGAWSVEGLSTLFELNDEQRIKFLDQQLTTAVNSFTSWDFQFFQDSELPLLIGDTPLFDLRLGGDRLPGINTNVMLMPLGPRAAVIGTSSGQARHQLPVRRRHWTSQIDCRELGIQVTFAEGPLPASSAGFFNHSALHRARRWLVASSERELLASSELLQPEQVQARMKGDTVAVLKDGTVVGRDRFGLND